MLRGLLRTTREFRSLPWVPDDRYLVDEGAAGERIVARVRLTLASVITLVPIVNLLRAPGDVESFVGLVATIGSTVVGVVLLLLTGRGFYRPWLGIATSIYDVTSISAVLVVFLALGDPLLATNSLVVFPIYLVAIAMTTLRYDMRVCIAAGAAALVQYGAIIAIAWRMGASLPPGAASPSPYGLFSWGDQVGRLILLVAMTLLAAVVAARSVRLRRLSVFDGLTGLHTRGYFEERLAEELRRASRYRRDVSIAIIDIDRYKEFNDRYGHPAGDAGLKVVASALRRATRATDIVARYGGEEFVIILPETRACDAVAKLDAIRREIEQLPVETLRGTMPARLTISAGVASWPGDGTWPDELLCVADDRLLEAKRDGRNRVFGPPVAAGATNGMTPGPARLLPSSP